MEPRSYDSLEHAVSGCFGEDVKISGMSYVPGGDINEAFCLKLDNGRTVFVKSNTLKNRSFFDAECEGLEAIASTGTVRTPKIICVGSDSRENRSFLMMEMIERTRQSVSCWEEFGRKLAAMHRADTTGFVKGGRFGFTSDNFIGATKQINTYEDTWIAFFVKHRLEPQFAMASGYFDSGFHKEIIRFLDGIDKILIEPDAPSLLHGDMWSGNIITDECGSAMLIDPAAYVGCSEADIAMTELFGKLPEQFYGSYRENYGLQDGYERRRDIYNLYHLLNHLNLFGRSYLRPVMDIVRNH